MTKRMQQKNQMLELWEEREVTLTNQNTSLTQQLEHVVALSAKREEVMQMEISNLVGNVHNNTLKNAGGKVYVHVNGLPLDVESQKESGVLKEELERVQSAFEEYRTNFNDGLQHDISEQVRSKNLNKLKM